MYAKAGKNEDCKSPFRKHRVRQTGIQTCRRPVYHRMKFKKCGMHGREFWRENLEETDRCEDLGIDTRILLKWMLNK
jgi:endonuclease YncB( thermonuclease family)